jgi:hypothetical protein
MVVHPAPPVTGARSGTASDSAAHPAVRSSRYVVHMDLYMCPRAELPAGRDATVVIDQGIGVRMPAG